ncbi:MAG: cytochrome c [Actinobacteria bacterium]|nr:cytochrome c [Actinomycetota bacterium]
MTAQPLGARLLLLLAVLMLVATACGGGADDQVAEQDPVLVAKGGELYKASCAECHGSDLRGTDRGPSHLSILYQPGHHGDGAFQIAVLIGSTAHHWDFGPMPPVEGLSEDDVEAITAFVRQRQREEGFEPYPP